MYDDVKLVESIAREMWDVIRALDPEAPTVHGPADESAWRSWSIHHPRLAEELRGRARRALSRSVQAGALRPQMDLRLKEAMVSWDL